MLVGTRSSCCAIDLDCNQTLALTGMVRASRALINMRASGRGSAKLIGAESTAVTCFFELNQVPCKTQHVQ